MVSKKKIKYPIFVFSLFIGIGLMGIAFLQPEFIFGQTIDFDRFGGVDTSSGIKLDILEVPIDPTSGAVLGVIKLGAPDVVPFERSGSILTPSGTGRCVEDVDPASAFDYQVRFGRQLSGDRNVSPIWHGYNGNCAYAYMEFDLVDIPNSFVATSVRFQLKLTQVWSDSSRGGGCGIMHIEQSFDQIGERSIAQRVVDSEFGRPASTNPIVADPLDFWVAGQNVNFGNIQSGKWCQTVGVKTFNWGKQTPDTAGIPAAVGLDLQVGVDAFNRALTDGQDKFTVLIFWIAGDQSGSDTTWALDYDWWKTNGSFLIEGTSDPIRCGPGFNQVDFRCIPIICPDGEKVDVDTNDCTAIICGADETLQGNLCVPLICQPGEEIVAGQCLTIVCESGTQLIGSTCDPLLCQEGFEISGNECTLKQCSTGMELIGDNCQAIQCPINTILVGNDCMERTCPAGQVSSSNECISETTLILCVDGFKQVGDQCVPIDLDCPIGTEAFENVCVQRLPSLLIIGGGMLDPDDFLVAGAITVILSVIGIIVRRI